MKPKLVLILAILLAIGCVSAYAGNAGRIGSAGAQELRIPYGSRGTAMGGAVVANTSGIESMYWNPAGLALIEGSEVMFSYLPYIADIDQNFVGVATHVEDFGTIGAGVKVTSIGDIEETTVDFPDGTGRVFSPSFSVLNLTFARTLTANVSMGATMMFINEKIHEVSASGMAFDIGFLYDPGWHGVRLGLVMKNYGNDMTFKGRGFDGAAAGSRPVKFDLPASINFGLSYDMVDDGPNMATLSGNFRSNTYSTDLLQAGFEYVYDGLYSLRGGYNYASQDGWISGATAGGGLIYDMGGTKLKFEYAWNQTDTFQDNQFFTVSASF